jgi:predicted DNA-binding protein YlxM (UPF0122 family)
MSIELQKMSDDIKTVEYASMLYDFYGALLSEDQSEVMALYHEDNFSLSEIAAEMGMTRQAVHYKLKKAENALRSYEDKLGLLASYEKNQKLASKAERILQGLMNNLDEHTAGSGKQDSESDRRDARSDKYAAESNKHIAEYKALAEIIRDLAE